MCVQVQFRIAPSIRKSPQSDGDTVCLTVLIVTLLCDECTEHRKSGPINSLLVKESDVFIQ